MKVYFYTDQDLNMIQKKWKEGRFPGHFLYGATHLSKYGVDVVMHKHKTIAGKFQQMLYVAMRILTCKEHCDAVYATTTNGLELIMMLRALHLFRKPVLVWQQQPIVKADKSMRQMMDNFTQKGIDRMFFFSEKLIQKSLPNTRMPEERMVVCPWGADLDNYDRLKKENPVEEHVGFISTGKEKRDMPTLIRAFSATGQELNIHIAYKACGDNYVEILNDLRPSSNVHVAFTKGAIPNELAQKVWASKCVAICCQETNYAVGMTTLMEALALGLPVIATRNEYYPFDIEKEGVGIVVPYYDSVAWEKAIRFISNNPEETEAMGKKARELAEKTYNLDNLTRTVADAIKEFAPHKVVKPVVTETATPKPVQKDIPVKSVAESAPVQTPAPVVESAPVQAPTSVVETAPVQAPISVVESAPVQTPAQVVETTPTQAPTPAHVQTPAPVIRPQMSKEIEDFYADVPQLARARRQADMPASAPVSSPAPASTSATSSAPSTSTSASSSSSGSQPSANSIININTEELKARLKGMAEKLPTLEQIQSYLPTKEQVNAVVEDIRKMIQKVINQK